MVAMESIGSYWKPFCNIFEQESLPAMVCNAYHFKNVPGRKTDWNDAIWIAKCLALTTQREFFAHIMNVIRTQTALIEKTDFLIKSNLTEDAVTVAGKTGQPWLSLTRLPLHFSLSCRAMNSKTLAQTTTLNLAVKKRLIHT